MAVCAAPMVWVTITVAGRGDGRRSVLFRTGVLTPYVAETIGEDMRRAGRGARLELAVAPDASDDVLTGARRAFAHLGVPIRIARRPLATSHYGPDAA